MIQKVGEVNISTYKVVVRIKLLNNTGKALELCLTQCQMFKTDYFLDDVKSLSPLSML